MAMSNKQLEALTWVLIYSGLGVACLGLFVQRGSEVMLGWVMIVAGFADAALGVALLWLRSRRPD